MKDRGIEALINDSLVGNVLFMGKMTTRGKLPKQLIVCFLNYMPIYRWTTCRCPVFLTRFHLLASSTTCLQPNWRHDTGGCPRLLLDWLFHVLKHRNCYF